MKLKKLNARGFSHHLAMVLVVLICAIGGTYYLVASHADDISTLLYLSPTSAPETVGNNFTVAINLNANGNSINFTHAVIEYPSNLLACVGANSEPGPFPVPDSATCGNGEVTINQNLQNQNLSGTTASNVPVATITFRALATGTASVSFVQGQTTVNIHQESTSPSTPPSTGSSTGSGSAPIVAVPNMSNAQYTISPVIQPAAPTNLSATVVSSSQINLTWTPSPNPNGTVAGYYLYRYYPNVGTSTTTLYDTFNNPNTSSTAVTGLLAGSAYSFYLKAYTISSSSSSPLLSPASATVLAAIPSPPVAPPTPAAEQLSIPPQRRPAQYLSLCEVGKTAYVSKGTSDCWVGGSSLIENYPASVPGTYYDVPCVSVSANSASDRFVYIATGGVCPEQTTPVPLQLLSGEQLSFPPARRPAAYLTQCNTGNTTYVSLDSCVYRLPNTVYQFTYTPPVAGTYYSVPCATVTQGGAFRYLYVSASESCPVDTFGNLSLPSGGGIAKPL